MAYNVNRLNPQLVVVDARVNNQQVVNTFWYRHGTGAAGSGTSTSMLTEFRDAYRLLLAFFWSTYVVANYTIREVNDAVLNGLIWQPVFDPFKVDGFPGVAPDDLGQLDASAEPMLPTHEALRVRKVPNIRVAGFHKSAYNRFAPWSEADHSNTAPERWVDGFITAINVPLGVFNNTTVDDGGANPQSWFHSVWSPVLYGRIVKPLGGPIYNAGSFCASYIASPYVGTQVTRRFSASGIFHGG